MSKLRDQMVVKAKQLREELLGDISDLSKSEEKAMRRAVELIEQHVVGDEWNFIQSKAAKDCGKAADLLEWACEVGGNSEIPEELMR